MTNPRDLDTLRTLGTNRGAWEDLHDPLHNYVDTIIDCNNCMSVILSCEMFVTIIIIIIIIQKPSALIINTL